MTETVAISALFVRKDSVYKTLGIDCWDIERDATNWPGGNPIIAHPPCRAWGKLSAFAHPRPGEKELAIKSIELIREWGGYWNTQRLADYGQNLICRSLVNMMNTVVSVSVLISSGSATKRRRKHYYTYADVRRSICRQRPFGLMQ